VIRIPLNKNRKGEGMGFSGRTVNSALLESAFLGKQNPEAIKGKHGPVGKVTFDGEPRNEREWDPKKDRPIPVGDLSRIGKSTALRGGRSAR